MSKSLSMLLFLSTLLLVVSAAAAADVELWALRTFSPKADKLLQKAAREWADKNKVSVAITFFDFAEARAKYREALEQDSLPCVGELDTAEAPRMSALGALTPLDDLAADMAKANGPLLEAVKPAVSSGGTQWAIPRYLTLSAFYVRKDLFDKYGLEAPDTWEQVRQAAKLISDHSLGSTYGLGLPYFRGGESHAFFQQVLWSFGAREANEAGSPVFDSPETLAALKFIAGLYNDKTVPPDVLTWQHGDNDEQYAAGKIAMTLNGPSLYRKLKEGKKKDAGQTILVKWPMGPAGEEHRSGIGLVQSFAVFKSCPKPEEAKKLIAHLSTGEAMAKYLAAGGGSFVPVHARLGEGEPWKGDANYRALLENAGRVRFPGYAGALTPAAILVRREHVLSEMVRDVLERGRTPEEALAGASERIREIHAASPAWR